MPDKPTKKAAFLINDDPKPLKDEIGSTTENLSEVEGKENYEEEKEGTLPGMSEYVSDMSEHVSNASELGLETSELVSGTSELAWDKSKVLSETSEFAVGMKSSEMSEPGELTETEEVEEIRELGKRTKSKKKLSIALPEGNKSMSSTGSNHSGSDHKRRRRSSESGRRRSLQRRKSSVATVPKSFFIEILKKKIEDLRRSQTATSSEHSVRKSFDTEGSSDNTPATSSTTASTKQRKKRSKKKKSFNKPAFIKKLLKINREITNLGKVTQKNQDEKKNVYEQWDEIVDRYLKAKREHCIMKRKADCFKMEENHGVWVGLRKNKNNTVLKVYTKLNDLGVNYTKALIDLLENTDTKNHVLMKKIIETDRGRFKIRQEFENVLNKHWKDENLNEHLYLQYNNRYMKKKGINFDLSFKNKLKEVSKSLNNKIQETVLNKKAKLKEIYKEHATNLQDCFNVYSGVVENNFFFIQQLSYDINGLKWKRFTRKTYLENLQRKMKKMEERLAILHDRKLELIGFVQGGKHVRRSLTRLIQRKKDLEYQLGIASINHEYKYHRNTEVTDNLEKSLKKLKNNLISRKKDFFKNCIKQSQTIGEQVFYEKCFKDIFDILTKSPTRKTEIPLAENEELVVPFEWLRVTVGDFKVDNVGVDKESEKYKKSFNAIVDFYKKSLSKDCLRLDDLNFIIKDRPPSSITDIKRLQDETLEKIKQDVEAEKNQDSRHIKTWSIKSINYT